MGTEVNAISNNAPVNINTKVQPKKTDDKEIVIDFNSQKTQEPATDNKGDLLRKISELNQKYRGFPIASDSVYHQMNAKELKAELAKLQKEYDKFEKWQQNTFEAKINRKIDSWINKLFPAPKK